jgi:hypothetical protein
LRTASGKAVGGVSTEQSGGEMPLSAAASALDGQVLRFGNLILQKHFPQERAGLAGFMALVLHEA